MKKHLLLLSLLACGTLLTSCGNQNLTPEPGPNTPVTPVDKYSFALTVGEGGTASAYLNGKEITPENFSDNVESGTSITLVVTPSPSYQIESVKFNGEGLAKNGANYTFTVVEGENKIEVTFKKIETNTSDFGVEIIDDTHASITSYTPSSSTIPNPVVIPDTITQNGKTYEINSISAGFLSYSAVISIELNSKIEFIDDDAFTNANSLSSILVNESNPYFESEDGILYSKSGALIRCPISYHLNNLTVKEGTTSINKNAFNNCNRIQKVTLPEGLVSIGESAFDYATGLNSINFPSSLKSIGTKAFNYTNSLASVTLNEGLTSLGEQAFNSCACKTLTLPSTLKFIPTYAFYDCTSLTTVHFAEGLEEIGEIAFGRGQVLEELNFPSTLKKIDASAFSDCTGIKEITFNEGLEEIGNYAFMNANYIEAINLPSTLKTIGINPFSGIIALGRTENSFTISKSNPYFEIVDNVLYSKGSKGKDLISYPFGKNVETYSIIDGTTHLLPNAFVNNGYLLDVTIPVSVIDINQAFQNLYSELTTKPTLTIRYLGTKEEFSKINLHGNNGEWHSGTAITNSEIICSDGALEIN